MNEDSHKNLDETKGEKDVAKRSPRPSEGNGKKSFISHDMNERPMNSNGGPVCVHAIDKIDQLSEPEEIVAPKHHNTVRCGSGKYSGEPKKKFHPFFFRRGCSKHCTGYNKNQDNSSNKLTVCEASKPNDLSHRIKRSKKKVQEISNQVKSRTKKSMKKIQKMYKDMGTTRAVGFNCDLRDCPSTLLECSERSCTKENMLFSKIHKQKEEKTMDKVEDTSYLKSYDGRPNHKLKILRDQSVGTNVEQETST